MAIKRITAANENLTSGRSRVKTQEYWAKTHGPLVANNPGIRRYHHYFSLPEAYASEPKPTFIGISMFWRDDPFEDPDKAPSGSPMAIWRAFYAHQPGGADDAQLFDRTRRWPIDDQHADILGEEHVIIDAPTTPTMINAIFMVNRLPGLDHNDFFEHWLDVHAAVAAKLPGLRRYIQNHVVLEMLSRGAMTHDGWSELWFDDFAAFQRACASTEWQAMEADGRTLFAPQQGIVIGREYVQKDESWKPRDWGVNSSSEAEVRERLGRDGYAGLAADPAAPAKIKAAAANSRLAVWTPDHIATYDDSPLDSRPRPPHPEAAASELWQAIWAGRI